MHLDFYPRRTSRGLIVAFLAALIFPLCAAELSNKAKGKNDKHPANVSVSDDPLTAMKKLSVAPGLKLELFAAEPLLQDVVSFDFDSQGRAYVVETGRRRTSVYDIRKHRDWTDADLSFRTVEDRVAWLKAKLTPTNSALPKEIIVDLNGDGKFDWRDLEVESERIRLLSDTDGDGRADKSVVFADDFKTLVSGVAAGVLVHHGDVYFTCIPDLWRLRDTNGDGVAEVREKLHSGFGVHIAYGGHDMHGLIFGPDGKLYWSIADRGYAPPENIRGYGFSTEFLRRILPDTGAVFRCDPDGSNLEVVAVGLRNPQELAFDDLGNLFTVDNNADGGDKARVTYIVPGADYGWRYGWQHLPKLGAWNSEMLWGLAASNTAHYSLPPVAHVTHGPAGFAFYPGTGLPERFNRHFFVADFPGGIRHFQVKEQGAGFTVENPSDILQDNQPDNMTGKLLWNLYPTDVAFPPGGGVAVLDWVFGWEKTGKGRIYKLTDPAMKLDLATAETKLLLSEGMEKRSANELTHLLGHRDQRVRLEAQRALVKRRESGALEKAVRQANSHLAALHGLWGLEQLRSGDWIVLKPAAKHSHEALRVAAYASLTARGAEASLVAGGLADAHPRVVFAAAQAFGQLRSPEATIPLFQLLKNNADKDPYLRHAAVCALVNIGDREALLSAAREDSAAVRLGVLLAMRRLEMPEVAMFLKDADPRLVLEAARAIADAPIDAALPQLASLLNTPAAENQSPFVLRRAINANFRLGRIEHAQALINLAAKPTALEALRLEALEAVSDWVAPSGRDRITGLWRPLPAREGRAASIPLRMSLDELLTKSPAAVRIAALQTAVRLELLDVTSHLHALLADAKQEIAVRVEALRGLAQLKDASLQQAVALAQADKSEVLRKEASRLLGHQDGAEAVAALSQVLEKGSLGEKQAALETLAKLKEKDADALLRRWLDRLLAGQLPPALHLDLLEAAAKRSSPSVKEKLKAFEQARDKKDPLAVWRETLHGGDAKLGREIFYERAEAGCIRCHKYRGEGGEVGPDLSNMSTKNDRAFILESIIFPNHQVAPGYETLSINLKNGSQVAGLVKGETGEEITLHSPEDGVLKIKKADIETKARGLSAMPEEIAKILSKQDLRNLVEFLATAP